MRRVRPVDLGARLVAAVAGGYILTLLAARAMAALLPLDGREASMTASLSAWPVSIAVVIWCFAARTAVSAIAPVVMAGGALYLLAR